jgi:hypothetical protein
MKEPNRGSSSPYSHSHRASTRFCRMLYAGGHESERGGPRYSRSEGAVTESAALICTNASAAESTGLVGSYALRPVLPACERSGAGNVRVAWVPR